MKLVYLFNLNVFSRTNISSVCRRLFSDLENSKSFKIMDGELYLTDIDTNFDVSKKLPPRGRV